MMQNELKDGTFRGHFGPAMPLEVKLDGTDETGEFEGYASTFDNADNGFDVVKAGAFLTSLRERPAARVKLLYQHRTDEPLGKILELREDDRGLFMRGKLNFKVAKAVEVHALMEDGALDGMSIGYRVKRSKVDEDRMLRELLELQLMEVSIVTFPMNENAMISRVKAGNLPTERQFEEYLTRDAGFSSQQAKAIIANGYKSLKTERDAGQGDERNSLSEAIQQMLADSSSF